MSGMMLGQMSQDAVLRAMRWAGSDPGALIGVAGLAVLGYLAYRLARHIRTAETTEAKPGLFERMAQEHGLTREETGLLREVTNETRVENPAILFVRKSLLEGALRREPRPELETLMHKLFD